MKLKGKKAIVTGAGNGIGRAISLRLAQEGADIILFDIDHECAKITENMIRALGRRALKFEIDVRKLDEVKEMVDIVIREFNAIDILINNAGVTAGKKQTIFSETTEDNWNYLIDVNLKGTFNCTHAVINHMISRKQGKIVNISSTTGLVGTPGAVDYSATKAAIIGFTMALAKEVAQYNIYVNSVAPGNTDTDMFRKLICEQSKTFDTSIIIKSSGLNRVAKPEEIAAMVAFLASEDSDYITGQTFPVCGLRNIGLL